MLPSVPSVAVRRGEAYARVSVRARTVVHAEGAIADALCPVHHVLDACRVRLEIQIVPAPESGADASTSAGTCTLQARGTRTHEARVLLK